MNELTNWMALSARVLGSLVSSRYCLSFDLCRYHETGERTSATLGVFYCYLIHESVTYDVLPSVVLKKFNCMKEDQPTVNWTTLCNESRWCPREIQIQQFMKVIERLHY